MTGRIALPAIAIAAALLAVVPATASAAAPLLTPRTARAVPGRYIVVLKSAAAPGTAARTRRGARNRGGRVRHVYSRALHGFSAQLPAAALADVRDDPAVAYVERDSIVTAATTQTGAVFGLDRIDQRNLPLSTTYSYEGTGAGVTAYVIDTGIHISHAQFGGRARYGVDELDGALPADDCNGHGTHVAGTLGGSTYGVAKGVSLVAVRVLDCNGGGHTSDVVAGVEWVTGDHQAGAPAVANMSLGALSDPVLDDAVSASIADGVTYAVAAGNENGDACATSPAETPNAITVGAVDGTDTRASFSNFGSCVDLFAPGVGIQSAWYTSNTATKTLTGTSQATPHVAGVAALYLGRFPTGTPATVTAALIDGATADAVTNPGAGSPNRLLYSPIAGPTVTSTPSAGFTIGAGRLTDAAVATGTSPVLSGAKLAFRLYGPDDAACTGTPVFATVPVDYPAIGATVVSPPFAPTAAGTYRWVASYEWSLSRASNACNAAPVVVSPAPAPKIASLPDAVLFDGSLKRVRVSKTGRFTYGFRAASGRRGKARLGSIRKVRVRNRLRRINVAAKSFTGPASTRVKLHFKLSAASLAALKTRASLRFNVTVTVGTSVFTAKVTLSPPSR